MKLSSPVGFSLTFQKITSTLVGAIRCKYYSRCRFLTRDILLLNLARNIPFKYSRNIKNKPQIYFFHGDVNVTCLFVVPLMKLNFFYL
jgi:hypothetical protein